MRNNKVKLIAFVTFFFVCITGAVAKAEQIEQSVESQQEWVDFGWIPGGVRPR